MNWRTTIDEIGEDYLSIKRWRFWLRDGADIELDFYGELSKPTKRHQFRVDKFYERLTPNRGFQQQRINKPEVPEHIKKQVIERLASEIKFL